MPPTSEASSQRGVAGGRLKPFADRAPALQAPAVSMPRLDLQKIREQDKLDAPVTVDRLINFLRTRSRPANESEAFLDFEDRVNELIHQGKDPETRPPLRVFAFYDEGIIPSGSIQAAPRTTRPVAGESALELLYMFYAGRQQPGMGGLTKDVSFMEICSFNASMSFAELIKFTNMHFAMAFTRNEMAWFSMIAKRGRLCCVLFCAAVGC